MKPRVSSATVVLVAIAVLAGCATTAPAAGPAASSSSPTPPPTAACPAIEGVEVPPECAPYDPEEAMAANDRYRERMPLEEAAENANSEIAETVRGGLEELRSRGDVSVKAVEDALHAGGLVSAQVRDDYGRILFGASGPAGGCVLGEVTESGVSVDVGGYILDGGCLPAQ